MFSVAIIRDRRKVAGDDKPGSLDVRITIDRKSHYISTGIRVLGKHWRGAVVARPDADALNARLGIIVRRVNEKINESLEQNKPIDVENMPFYKLVIIDESHNLRNREGARYQNIKKFIAHQDCQVLLLSATPYNKDYSDLSNQLRLFLDEDADLGIRPERYLEKATFNLPVLSQFY